MVDVRAEWDVNSLVKTIRQSVVGCATHPAGPIATFNRLREVDNALLVEAVHMALAKCHQVAHDAERQGDDYGRAVAARERMIAEFLQALYL